MSDEGRRRLKAPRSGRASTDDAMAGNPPGSGWGEPRSRSVTWYDPAVTVAGGAGLSGLEFMQAIMTGTLPPPPIAQLLNMRVRHVERGLAVFECKPDESVYNPIGLVHGGLACTLADSALGCAVQTTLDAGVAYTSIDITVNYLRPVTLDSGTLVASGRVVKPGRRVAAAAAEVHDGAGRLVATATSNCLVMGPG
jgi:uncharacterized protein (TIGR00369 family)